MFGMVFLLGAAWTLQESGHVRIDLISARLPERARIAIDIAGGLLVTLPSEKDFDHPEIGPILEKYLHSADPHSTGERRRMLRLVENLTLGPGAAAYLTESMHGAGSPQAQRIMLAQLADLEEKMQLAKKLAGIL